MTLALGEEHVNTFALEMGQKQHTDSLTKRNRGSHEDGIAQNDMLRISHTNSLDLICLLNNVTLEATERVLKNNGVGSAGHFSIRFIVASKQSSFIGEAGGEAINVLCG